MLATRTSVRAGARPAQTPRAGSRRSTVRVQALFGWGKPKEEEEEDWKKIDRENEYIKQQELLQKRRSGVLIKEANARRQKVSETLQAKKDVRAEEKRALARGEIPETFKSWQPYTKEANERAKSGIVVPLLPFGIRKYDDGERFDLRSPYADEGWVDPEEVDMWGGFKKISQKILDFGQVKYVKPGEKPILWASDYARMQREKGEKGKESK